MLLQRSARIGFEVHAKKEKDRRFWWNLAAVWTPDFMANGVLVVVDTCKIQGGMGKIDGITAWLGHYFYRLTIWGANHISPDVSPSS